MEAYKPNRIVVCGHSLGGAVSALVYIFLHERLRDTYELHNITFASPLFGNLALRDYLKTNNITANLLEHMYHYVVAEDIVPALLYINKTYGETTFTAKKLWKKIVRGWIEDTEIAEKFVKEVKQQKRCHDPFFLFEEEDGYVAMGNYLFLKDDKLFQLPNDPQWIGQALVGSLTILGQLGLRAGFKMAAGSTLSSVEKILQNHNLTTYKSRINKVLSN